MSSEVHDLVITPEGAVIALYHVSLPQGAEDSHWPETLWNRRAVQRLDTIFDLLGENILAVYVD